MMTETLRYFPASTLPPEVFDEIYALLSASLPQSEMRSREGQRALLENPAYQLSLLRRDGRLGAFLATWELEDFRFVEHFAVDGALRGVGVGGTMLEEYAALSDKPVVLEVETPQTEMAARRIGFYERHGFRLNRCDYVQPPLQEGMELCPLYVMSRPDALTAEQFNRVRLSLYRTVYQLADPEGWVAALKTTLS